MVISRLGDLSRAERDLLDMVAFGEPLTADKLNLLGPRPVAEELERKGC